MGMRILGAFMLVALSVSVAARAHDLDKTDHNSPEVSSWVLSLHNGNGVGCCATADGWKPELVEWDMTKHGYRVMIEGHWVDVPAQAMVRVAVDPVPTWVMVIGFIEPRRSV